MYDTREQMMEVNLFQLWNSDSWVQNTKYVKSIYL